MATKAFKIGNKYSPRELMEFAVLVMHDSIPEHTDRTDPLVGAVLAKEDGTLVDFAYRGELRQGDHAEFTVLERKHRNAKLDGFVIYATLEPCAPGARSFTKLGCAERIVNARLKKAYIGIEDPDPSVKGNGLAYLRRQYIEIDFFDQDLQEEIIGANELFLKEAIDRAKRAELDALEQNYSPLELSVDGFEMKDFSTEALEKFREQLQIGYPVDSPDFRSVMLKWALVRLDKKTNQIQPTGLGLLLFGKNPQVIYPQSLVKCTLKKDNKVIPYDVDGPLVLMPGKLETYLNAIFPSSIDRGTMAHTEQKEVYFEVLREVVINAIVHRDYTIEQANINLKIDEEKIVVESPGKPLVPIERLQNYTAPTFSVNPKIANVFYQMKYIEKRNLGMEELKAFAKARGVKKPAIEFDDPYLIVKLFRKGSEEQEPTLENIQELVLELGKISVGDYVNRFGGSTKTAARKLNEMVDAGVVIKEGEKRWTRYFFNPD